MRLNNIVQLIAGSSQFRIEETNDEFTQLYKFYGQIELENDLVGFENVREEPKCIKTHAVTNTVDSGDVMFSLISGKATLVRKCHQDYVFTQNYVKLVPLCQIDYQYLVYLLNEDIYIKRQFQMGLQGSVVLKYTVKQLADLKLPLLPSLKNQKRIGDIYFTQLRAEALQHRQITLKTQLILELLRRGTNEK